jgi:hypothetical protein
MQLQEQLKEFLENISLMRSLRKEPDWKFSCYEEMYLKYGIFMEPREVPKELKSEPSYCYYNCQQIIRKRKYKGLAYVEGYAIAQNVSIPINHAWLLDGDGYAIDPTWKETGLLYFGIPLSNSWVKSFIKARSRGDDLSVFTGNYLENFSLLKEGLPPKTIVNLKKSAKKT